MSDAGTCVICCGTGKNLFNEACPYCHGTGEHNNLAEEYLKNHVCQCILWDRLHCPICKKICHHDSSQTPKQKIDPGYGGMTSTISCTTTGNDSVSVTVGFDDTITTS